MYEIVYEIMIHQTAHCSYPGRINFVCSIHYYVDCTALKPRTFPASYTNFMFILLLLYTDGLYSLLEF